MNFISSEAVSQAMLLILLLLTVMIWNGVKRIGFLGGLSKIILTFGLSMLGLIAIGEIMAVPSAAEIDPNQPKIQGVAENPPVKVNPFIDAVPSLIAGFLILLLVGMIVFAEDISIETLLELPQKIPKDKSVHEV